MGDVTSRVQKVENNLSHVQVDVEKLDGKVKGASQDVTQKMLHYQLHGSSDCSEEGVVQSVKVRRLNPARNTDVKPNIQFADQHSMENKIDRLEKALSDLVHVLNCSPTRTQQPSLSQMACYECVGREDIFA